jgi:hypothetical protein
VGARDDYVGLENEKLNGSLKSSRWLRCRHDLSPAGVANNWPVS